jgi:DNA-directed RNA polymerase beta subunit
VNRGRRDASVNISYIKDISILLMLRLILSFLYKVYLKHNSLGDDIPIVIVLKAMGLESDQEIVELVGYEPELVDLFSGSLEEPYLLGIYSRDEALSFIGNKVRAMRTSSNNGNFQVMK